MISCELLKYENNLDYGLYASMCMFHDIYSQANSSHTQPKFHRVHKMYSNIILQPEMIFNSQKPSGKCQISHAGI